MLAEDTRLVWQDAERPGYLGAKRDEKYREFNDKYGFGRWRIIWKWGGNIMERPLAIAVYEDAYYHFLRDRPRVLEYLVSAASDVYDDNVSNIHSKLDYTIQETGRTHLQDIAIRRVVRRLGRQFEGKELVQIRDREGEHELSMTLSPGRVPFHMPSQIEQPELKGWWQEESIESYYQSNKWLQVMSG